MIRNKHLVILALIADVVMLMSGCAPQQDDGLELSDTRPSLLFFYTDN